MFLLDIHTHNVSAPPGVAIENVSPEAFSPSPGKYYSLGIHPWWVDKITDEAWSELRKMASHSQVLAIGETGFDKLCASTMELQKKAFYRQARLGEEIRKPLILHVVKATAELLEAKRLVRPSIPWIIHGFRGKLIQATDLLRHGFYLSFGEHYSAEVLRTMPADKLLLETDESSLSIEELVAQAAFLRGEEVDSLRLQIQQNTHRLFA